MTSHSWVQFSIGRVVAYFAVGLVENAVPGYNAETSPPAVRGLFAGSIMFLTALGNLWGAGMSRAYSTHLGKEGWMIPVAMQFIPAVGILALVPFTPEVRDNTRMHRDFSALGGRHRLTGSWFHSRRDG